MTHAILVLTVVVLCLAAAGGVTYVNAPMFLKPRTRFPVVRIARPGGPPPLPASGAARHLPRCACGHTPGSHYASGRCSACDCRCGLAPAPTRADLPIPPPRNGVPLQDRPRQTVDVIICDPAVTPVVPRYYRAWLAGWFTP